MGKLAPVSLMQIPLTISIIFYKVLIIIYFISSFMKTSPIDIFDPNSFLTRVNGKFQNVLKIFWKWVRATKANKIHSKSKFKIPIISSEIFPLKKKKTKKKMTMDKSTVKMLLQYHAWFKVSKYPYKSVKRSEQYNALNKKLSLRLVR